MKRLFRITLVPLSLAGLGVALFLALFSRAPAGALVLERLNHEVWMIDQSGFPPSAVPAADIGGSLYIFDGGKLAEDVANAVLEVLDLAALVQQLDPSAAPRPATLYHLQCLSHARDHCVRSDAGHVLIIEAATRAPVSVVDVGVQAHAAVPSPDESYILVANQNGKLLQRINTNYATNTFLLDDSATLDLANGTTPSGTPVEFDDPAGGRPDNAPILALPDATGNLAFVTLRGPNPLSLVTTRSSITPKDRGRVWG